MSDKERLSYAITLDMSQLETAAKKASNAFTDMGSNIENESRRIDQSMKTIGTAAAAYFSVSALNNFAQSVIQVRGEIESLEISFATLLGSTSKAKELFGAIREFEVKTPMTLEPLAKGAQTLLGFGIEAEKVMPILRQLGDISMGNAERFQSLTLAFAQASANGKLMGQDLLQMINAGFNPLSQMSKDTGKSIAELREEMSEGRISAEDMAKAFAGATAEGGQFYGMLEKQSEGINGALSNLEGTWNSMLNEIGSKQQETFVNGVNVLNNIIQHYDVFMNAILSVAAAYGTYKAALMAVWVVEKARNLTDSIRLIMMFRKELGLLTAAQQAFNITALANPYILLAGAIAGVVAALVLYNNELTEAEKKQSELQSHIDTINSKSQERKQKIESLVQVIRDETTAEIEAAKALKELRSLLPETTKGLSDQAIKTGDLTKFTKSYNEELSKQIGLEKQNELNRLYAQKKNLEYWIKTDRSTKGYKYTHRANENQAILDVVNKQIEVLEKEKKEFFDLQKQLNNDKPSIYGEDYQKAKKEWEEAKRELEKIQKEKDKYTSEEYKNAKSRVESTKKAYEALGGETNLKSLQKQSDDQNKLIKEVSKMREQVLQNASNAEISTMQDGLAKRLREIENQKEQTLAAIDKEESELSEKLGKVGQTLSASDKQAFKTQREAANTEAINARFEAEKENAEYVKGLYKNLTDVFVSEEERKIDAIKQTYQEQRKQLGKDLAGGNINQEQYNDLSSKINAAEAKEISDTWILAYGNYYQKREQLQRNWESRLATIPIEFQEEALKKYKQALSDMDIEANKTTSSISKLFGDMKDKTLKELEAINEKGQAALDFLKSGEWDNEKGKEFGISKETFDIWSKSPDKLKDISDALIDNKRAADELRPALDKIINGIQSLFSSGKDSKKLKQALDDIQNGIGEVQQTASFLSNTFSQLGESFGSNVMSGIADGINVAMDSVNSAMQGAQAGAMFGPIGASAGAAIGMVTSLASAIAKIHDKKNEKNIQRLQDQIDALDKSYDRLGQSIEESYSKDASNLIEQNNKLLEQQKLLIQQQIREEEDKKKTDDNRIKEWQQQIEEINELIEENKEKAIDAIFGETLQSAIENFSDAYAEAWASNEDRTEAAKNTVKKMMQQMVTESIKAAIKSSKSMEQIRNKLQEFYADNVLSGWEQDYIYNMAEQLQKELDQQFGWADSLFKDETIKEEPERTSAEKSTITASQESVDRVDGRLTVMQGHTYGINEGVKELNMLANKMLEHLAGIENNTAKIEDTNEKLDTMNDRIKTMSVSLNDIQLKGVKIKK